MRLSARQGHFLASNAPLSRGQMFASAGPPIMKTQITAPLFLLALVLAATAPAAPPNVVIILSDDQAWTDYSFMGQPHLDRLASQSVVFTRGYTPTSLCRASLMSIITGQHPHRHGVVGNDPPKGTDRREMLRHVRRAPLLPKLLAGQGYVSLQTGKWWEGNYAEGGFTAGMTHGDPAGEAGMATRG
jgi:arylsulfatase A-like enzyme